MSYEIGDSVSTQKGKALCTGHAENKAIFECEDGTVFDLPNIQQEKTMPTKRRYKSEPLPVVKPSTEAQLSDLDKMIAEAEAKKAKLAALKETK